LPGERHSVFNTNRMTILDKPVPDSALGEIRQPPAQTAKYRQDSNNVIWRISDAGEIRIFSGFPTAAHIAGDRHPTLTDRYLFAGLSTGEVVKIDRNAEEVAWVADIFRASAMTGGSTILDIVAPIVVDGNRFVYAGGLGNAFCRLNFKTGARMWCTGIGVGVPFISRTGVSYVVATDNHLYAIDNRNGNVFWRTELRAQARPELRRTAAGNPIILVGNERVDALTGEIRDRRALGDLR